MSRDRSASHPASPRSRPTDSAPGAQESSASAGHVANEPESVRVLVLDNYDSFTYNLVQYLGELGAEVTVLRNDAVTVAAISAARPDRIVISPGPGRPEDAGVTMDVIRDLGRDTPILGVCLGHQAIGAVFG